MPWLFVCSEFFHLIWGVHSFHLQCAVNFFYSVCSVSRYCVGVNSSFQWQCWFNLFAVYLIEFAVVYFCNLC